MNIRTYQVCNGVKIKATKEGVTVTSTTGEKTYFDANGNLIKKKFVNNDKKEITLIFGGYVANHDCKNLDERYDAICVRDFSNSVNAM